MAKGDGRKSLVQRATNLRDQAAAGVVALGKNLLEASIGAFSEGTATGLVRVHRILHDAEAGPFFRRLGREYGDLVAKGKVKAGRITDPEVRTTLASITEDLDREIPDQRRLDILRRAFLGVAIGDVGDPDGAMGLAFLKTARELTGLQAQVLVAAFRVTLPPAPPNAHYEESRSAWLAEAQRLSGVPVLSVLRRELGALDDALLVTVSRNGPHSEHPVLDADRSALTEYGRAFCEFLQRAEPFPGTPPPKKPAS